MIIMIYGLNIMGNAGFFYCVEPLSEPKDQTLDPSPLRPRAVETDPLSGLLWKSIHTQRESLNHRFAQLQVT